MIRTFGLPAQPAFSGFGLRAPAVGGPAQAMAPQLTRQGGAPSEDGALTQALSPQRAYLGNERGELGAFGGDAAPLNDSRRWSDADYARYAKNPMSNSEYEKAWAGSRDRLRKQLGLPPLTQEQQDWGSENMKSRGPWRGSSEWFAANPRNAPMSVAEARKSLLGGSDSKTWNDAELSQARAFQDYSRAFNDARRANPRNPNLGRQVGAAQFWGITDAGGVFDPQTGFSQYKNLEANGPQSELWWALKGGIPRWNNPAHVAGT